MDLGSRHKSFEGLVGKLPVNKVHLSNGCPKGRRYSDHLTLDLPKMSAFLRKMVLMLSCAGILRT